MKLIIDVPEHMNAQINKLAKDRAISKASFTRWALGNLIREELKDDRNRNDPID